jgi:hypothetical protein
VEPGIKGNKNMRRSVTRGIVLVAAIAAAMPAQAQSVDPAPDTGTAIAGVAATPIINVAANDTVNGAPATLGASGNATIAQGAAWTAGIVRDPASGTVSTTASASLLAVQQHRQRERVVHVGSACCYRVNDLHAAIHPDVRLHPKVPLVAFLRLMHLRVTPLPAEPVAISISDPHIA